jgi:hypothetical protein
MPENEPTRGHPQCGDDITGVRFLLHHYDSRASRISEADGATSIPCWNLQEEEHHDATNNKTGQKSGCYRNHHSSGSSNHGRAQECQSRNHQENQNKVWYYQQYQHQESGTDYVSVKKKNNQYERPNELFVVVDTIDRNPGVNGNGAKWSSGMGTDRVGMNPWEAN